MLRIEHLTKTYGEKKAVDDLSLHIEPGQIYGFIGHNGAGKTTTIKACCGILKFDAGEIYVCGKSIKTQALECKRDIAYIPDNPDLYDFLSGIKYLNFIADVYGVPDGLRRERIERYLELFELTDAAGNQVRSYSRGMRQKITLIGALLHAPALWVLDEPMVGLDPKASHILKEEMRRHCAAGNTVFFSTHVLDVAERLCDRIGIIRAGKLVAVGTMDELRSAEHAQTLESIFLELTDAEGE